jgi:O-antigen/teichoic acid export membrane protein
MSKVYIMLLQMTIPIYWTRSMKKNIIKHFSFFVLLVSSGVYFLFNLWLKYVLKEVEYGDYGLLNSYITIAMAFGVMGADQSLMRTAEFKKRFVVGLKMIKFNLLLIFLFTLIAPSVLVFYFKSDANFIQVVICTFLSGFSVLIFSIFRISQFFTRAQLQKNLWRFLVFFICFFYFLIINKLTVDVILVAINLGLFVTILLAIKPIILLKIKLKKNEALDYKLWFGFFIAMLIMNILSNADRFIIDKFVGRAEVGHYFFLQNLFLFPLTQVQNYSGFREITVFKKEFTMAKLKESLKRNFYISLGLSLLLVFGFSVLSFFFIHTSLELTVTDKWVIFLLLLNGTVRIIYSVLSAAMGAIGNNQIIKKTNLWTIVVFCAISFLFCFVTFGIIYISLMFVLFWLSRAIIFYIYLNKI